MRNGRDPEPHICIVQSDRLVSKYAVRACLQFVHTHKGTFSSNILLLQFSFHLDFVMLLSTKREADDPDGAESKLNEIKAYQSDTRTS